MQNIDQINLLVNGAFQNSDSFKWDTYPHSISVRDTLTSSRYISWVDARWVLRLSYAGDVLEPSRPQLISQQAQPEDYL